MLCLDAFVHVTARLEHSQAVRSQNLEHRLFIGLHISGTHKVSFTDAAGLGHQESFDVNTGEYCLRQGVSQVPGHFMANELVHDA